MACASLPFSLWLSLCLLPPCHAPLSNLCSFCVSCLFSGVFRSPLFSLLLLLLPRCALSYLPLQSCEKVGTVMSVCGSFETFPSIFHFFHYAAICGSVSGCFVWGTEGLNLASTVYSFEIYCTLRSSFFCFPVSGCVCHEGFCDFFVIQFLNYLVLMYQTFWVQFTLNAIKLKTHVPTKNESSFYIVYLLLCIVLENTVMNF